MTYRAMPSNRRRGSGILFGVGVDTIYTTYSVTPPPPTDPGFLPDKGDMTKTGAEPEQEKEEGLTMGQKVAIGVGAVVVVTGVVFLAKRRG